MRKLMRAIVRLFLLRLWRLSGLWRLRMLHLRSGPCRRCMLRSRSWSLRSGPALFRRGSWSWLGSLALLRHGTLLRHRSGVLRGHSTLFLRSWMLRRGPLFRHAWTFLGRRSSALLRLSAFRRLRTRARLRLRTAPLLRGSLRMIGHCSRRHGPDVTISHQRPARSRIGRAAMVDSLELSAVGA